MARKLLWGSLALGPVTILVDKLTGAGDVTLFVLAALSLVPLAWLIGESTEHAAEHTGPGIGGFLNASFGNAPELIVALFAVGANLPDVVRGSLSGSVISNLLLVYGVTQIAGPDGARIDKRSLLVQLGLVGAAVDAPLELLIPLFVVAGVLSMSWNGLAYAAAAEAAGSARTGAALGFQQTLLGVVVAGAPPVVAAVAAHSWRLAFFLAAAGPAVGVVILERLRERARSPRPARTRGTSASLPAAPRTPD